MEISTTWKNESLLGELFGKNQYVIEIEGRHLKTSKAKARPEDNLCRDFRARFLSFEQHSTDQIHETEWRTDIDRNRHQPLQPSPV